MKKQYSNKFVQKSSEQQFRLTDAAKTKCKMTIIGLPKEEELKACLVFP